MVRCVGRRDHEGLSPAFLRKPRPSGIGNPCLDRSQTCRAQGVAALLDSFCHWCRHRLYSGSTRYMCVNHVSDHWKETDQISGGRRLHPCGPWFTKVIALWKTKSVCSPFASYFPGARASASTLCVRLTDLALRLMECASRAATRLNPYTPETALYGVIVESVSKHTLSVGRG